MDFKLNGFALIRQVRSLDTEAGGQIPAAAITAYVSDQERQLAINAGFQMHLGDILPAPSCAWCGLLNQSCDRIGGVEL